MSEIEKMYRNCNIEPDYTDECVVADKFWGNEELANQYGTFDRFMEKNCKFAYQDCTDECEYAYTKTNYPTFTAEKQLAILCWLVNLKGQVTFNNKPKDITPERLQGALVWAVNQYWTKLTPEQKQQIKEILE